MAFPSNSTTTPARKWFDIKDITGSIKTTCVNHNAAAVIKRREVLEFANALADKLAALDALTANATTNGLLDYARAQENNPTLDLAAEFTTMRNAIVATQNWIVNNFPKSATSELQVYVFDVNKRFADINLDSTQLSAYKTQINALSVTIA